MFIIYMNKTSTWYNNDCKTNLYLRHKCQYPPKCKSGYDPVSIYSNRHNCPEYKCINYNNLQNKQNKQNIFLEIIRPVCKKQIIKKKKKLKLKM